MLNHEKKLLIKYFFQEKFVIFAAVFKIVVLL